MEKLIIMMSELCNLTFSYVQEHIPEDAVIKIEADRITLIGTIDGFQFRVLPEIEIMLSPVQAIVKNTDIFSYVEFSEFNYSIIKSKKGDKNG